MLLPAAALVAACRDRPQRSDDAGTEVVDRWVALPAAGGPSARAGHSAAWTGSEMIVWGGQSSKPDYLVQATGGVLDLGRGEWRTSLRNPGVSARMDHIAFWIASRMWIWGGVTDEGDTDVGEQVAWYSPDADAWSVPPATSTQPQGRSSPVAVWTGRRLIVWGGGTQVVPGYLADGASYDPASDNWTPMSSAGAPSARYAAAAAWTGTRLVVWGGSGDPDAALTGGSYDPEADRWDPVSSSPPAPEVSFPVAAYTGRELIVWGQSPLRGARTSGQVVVAGAYDPERDSWRPIATEGGPTTRAFASAVWTGRWMIVWGGRSPEGQNLGDGARYDPEQDRWVALPTAGAPDGRIRHTAVWTGDAMLVWGGMATDVTTRGDGAAYFPPQ